MIVFEKSGIEFRYTHEGDLEKIDLVKLAKAIGHDRPGRAINSFRASIGLEPLPPYTSQYMAEEWEVFTYLGYSRTEKAIQFQIWVAKEVLPAVRKVGLQQLQVLAQLAESRDIAREDLLHDVDDEFLIQHNHYRLAGFFPPSHFYSPVDMFYAAAYELEYIDEEGELLEASAARHIPRFSGGDHLACGKWYAWDLEEGLKIAEYAKILDPRRVPRVGVQRLEPQAAQPQAAMDLI